MLTIVSSPMSTWSTTCTLNPLSTNLPTKSSNPVVASSKIYPLSLLSQPPPLFSVHKYNTAPTVFSSLKASSSVESAEYKEEPSTKVKFFTNLSLPGCSSSLSLVGTGYREKVFAIIGVKLYAAGLYINESILSALEIWRGKSASEIKENSAPFSSIFHAPSEKSLKIVLVRDIDGKTFWDALNDAISPRIKERTPRDESALTTFYNIFQGRPLRKGTFIFLTWLDPSKMLVSVSSTGIPSGVDATIESKNVSFALFDVFLGNAPVSPSLKYSVASGLATVLNYHATLKSSYFCEVSFKRHRGTGVGICCNPFLFYKLKRLNNLRHGIAKHELTAFTA